MSIQSIIYLRNVTGLSFDDIAIARILAQETRDGESTRISGDKIGRRIGMDGANVNKRINKMAERGLIQKHVARNGTSYKTLSPGFKEAILMVESDGFQSEDHVRARLNIYNWNIPLSESEDIRVSVTQSAFEALDKDSDNEGDNPGVDPVGDS